MRLRKDEVEAIKCCFLDVFQSGKIFLFGSRADDSALGGDIDLFLEPNDDDELFEKKITFLANLKLMIGDQKIDVVIARDPERSIEKEARSKGIRLL